MEAPKTKRTNKEVLAKGLKFMGICLACLFSGPPLAYISQTKLNTPIDNVVLIIAIIICALAIFFGFKGINTVLDSMFKSNK